MISFRLVYIPLFALLITAWWELVATMIESKPCNYAFKSFIRSHPCKEAFLILTTDLTEMAFLNCRIA